VSTHSSPSTTFIPRLISVGGTFCAVRHSSSLLVIPAALTYSRYTTLLYEHNSEPSRGKSLNFGPEMPQCQTN
jgi:hypothetical protein